jgi:hypothetical protein
VRRSIGIFLDLLRAIPELQVFVTAIFAEGFNSPITTIFYTSTQFVEEIYGKST